MDGLLHLIDDLGQLHEDYFLLFLDTRLAVPLAIHSQFIQLLVLKVPLACVLQEATKGTSPVVLAIEIIPGNLSGFAVDLLRFADLPFGSNLKIPFDILYHA